MESAEVDLFGHWRQQPRQKKLRMVRLFIAGGMRKAGGSGKEGRGRARESEGYWFF